jgi:hypothetical protein
MKKYTIILPCIGILALLGWSCVSAPEIEKPQFTQKHYAFSVLLDPEKLGSSPKLNFAMTLLQMEYPEDQAEYLHNALYLADTPDMYRDNLINEQRKNYREKASGTGPNSNWHYSETVNVKRYRERGMVMQRADTTVETPRNEGIVLERSISSVTGGQTVRIKRFVNLDMDEYRLLKIDDFFANFQEENRLRDIVYEELRKYSNLERTQALSQGIFFTNQPELSFNFFITDQGLGLHWDPGQIAPVTNGDIQVILPWQIIRPIMLFSGIELLAKFNIFLFV